MCVCVCDIYPFLPFLISTFLGIETVLDLQSPKISFKLQSITQIKLNLIYGILFETEIRCN